MSATAAAGIAHVRTGRRPNPTTLIPYAFIAPNVVLFGAFIFLPLLFALFVSFQRWDLIGDSTFIGTRNYARLLHDAKFWTALRNTTVYACGTVPTSLLLGLAVACGLNRRIAGRALLRSVYYLPVVVSGVAAGTLAAWLFNDNYGVINGLLLRMGLSPVPFLSSPAWALPSLIAATLWVRVGFCMVVYLAALQTIPAVYYEAARIDGASGWRQFMHITWPMLGPATLLLVVLNVIYSFQVFDLTYVMTGGGPGFATTMLPQYIYQVAFGTSQMGYASAIGMVLYAIILVLTVVQWRIGRWTENVH